MALRDQPYLPLYIQDFLTDEQLRECQAASVGVYVYIMCIMHKSKTYGKILLQQKDKQSDQQIKNFAEKLLHHLPYNLPIIEYALTDLLTQNVLYIDGDFLCQKRMIRDNSLSETRAKSGSNGGKKTAKKHNNFATAKQVAKHVANSEYEYLNNNSIVDSNKEGINNLREENFEKEIVHVKSKKNFPVYSDFNGLPELNINTSIELIRITQHATVSKSDIDSLWNVFKVQNLTGEKYYPSEKEVYSHFTNWVKNQKIEVKNILKTNKNEKLGTSEGQINAARKFATGQY